MKNESEGADMNNGIDTRYTQDRELSWLRFNERVLAEAKDESVPLMERLKFAAIFASNLDEFFMVRVGSLHDMSLVKEPHIDSRTGKTPQEQLQDIFRAVVPLYKQRDRILEELETRCRACNICRLRYEELDNRAKKQAAAWFENELRPILSPQIVDLHHPFPHLPNKGLSIVLNLQADGKELLGILQIPSSLPLFLRLEERGVHYILTEDILLEFTDQIFGQFVITDQAVICVTRNADISPEDEAYDVDMDFRQHMRKIMKKRTRLAPVRLEVQGGKDGKLVEILCSSLSLDSEQVFHMKYPIHLSYLFTLGDMLPKESAAALCDPPYTPVYSPSLNRNEKIIPQIERKDVLLFYPYESMDPFLRMISEAASDPDVLSIKITIYRLAARARLAEYLCAAAENGKQVTVLMELRARFDEQNNILWAERLEEAGCTLLYGFEGIKVHSKVCLIIRRERGRVRYITQIGTGNYNEKTAKQYTDLCLMTANQEIGEDAALLFQNMATANLNGEYAHLLVSPFALKEKVIACIDGEIAKGAKGYIFLKLNSLTDRKLIDKLSEASRAGVEVVMNIRGICCLLPGIEGLTEHIRVFSIVGRYLEHSRIYCFGRGESAKLYISSADFMTRNTERRVEVACPVLDQESRARLLHIIDELQRDNVKARVMRPDGTWHRIKDAETSVSCQEAFQQEILRAETEAKSNDGAGKSVKGLAERLYRMFRRKS
ncbi:MAG: polyphosphate kinase 1 [Lachnospiraceae bacterium]|nr:polyphosphate kinase 1 [Lachnospiraceae bacterium]